MRIPALEGHEGLVEMARIAASLEDGHTAIRGGFQFLSGQYPLVFYDFDDGLYVIRSTGTLAQHLGSRLIAIDDVPSEEAFRRVATATPHDNNMTLRNRVPERLVLPEILHGTGVTQTRTTARYALVAQDGSESFLALSPIPFDGDAGWEFALSLEQLPITRRNLSRNYWHTLREESNTLYVQYNRVGNAEEVSIADYFGALASDPAAINADRVILDMRYNGGGNDYFNAAVLDWIQRAPQRARGRFYVTIGRRTYSATQKLVSRLTATGVLFVGEPTGGAPNHFGDAREFTLPNSQLQLTVSSVFHEDDPGNALRWTTPLLAVPVLSAHYFQGYDPLFDAVLDYEANPDR